LKTKIPDNIRRKFAAGIRKAKDSGTGDAERRNILNLVETKLEGYGYTIEEFEKQEKIRQGVQDIQDLFTNVRKSRAAGSDESSEIKKGLTDEEIELIARFATKGLAAFARGVARAFNIFAVLALILSVVWVVA